MINFHFQKSLHRRGLWHRLTDVYVTDILPDVVRTPLVSIVGLECGTHLVLTGNLPNIYCKLVIEHSIVIESCSGNRIILVYFKSGNPYFLIQKRSTHTNHLVPGGRGDSLVPAHHPRLAAIPVQDVKDLDIIRAETPHLGLGFTRLVDPAGIPDGDDRPLGRHIGGQALPDLLPGDLRVDDRILALGRGRGHQEGHKA